jgi:nucleotide-binding universal stress UspA family protein
LIGGNHGHHEVMTITRVTIPVDFSEVSVAAVDIGRWLAGRAGTTTELVAVTTPRYERVTDAALASLVADQPDDTTTHRTITIDSDDIEGALVHDLLDAHDTLWCVGSHGRTALGELLFGSVSADLVRDAERPIVVAGPHATVRADADVLAVALDGSAMAETIVPEALRLAGALGMRLRLLQVGLGDVPADATDTAYLARVAERLLPHPDAADYDTLHGDVDAELEDYVERNTDVAMLALTTRGVPAGARLSVPSLSMKVLRKAVVPVLMLHPAEPEPSVTDPGATEHMVDSRRRVVVGIDSREASKPALEWAAGEAARRGAILQVVHSWSIPVGPGSVYGYPIWPDIEACRQGALDEVATTAAELTAAHPDLVVETIVAEGNPSHVIHEQAEGAELVVVGRHRAGRLARLLTGSTSEATVRHMQCPLVIVPCDGPDLDA